MKHFNRIAVGLLASLAMGTTAHAGALAPTKASQLIRLQSLLGSSSLCPNFGVKFDKQLNPDGTQSPFAGIPAGQALVVTDLSFDMSGVTPNRSVVGTLEVETATTFAPLMSAIAEGDPSGTLGGVASLTNGGVAKSGTTLCFATNSLAVTTQSAVINGYLTRDK